MEKLKRWTVKDLWTENYGYDGKICKSSDVSALEAENTRLEAHVKELESALATSRGKLQEAERALEDWDKAYGQEIQDNPERQPELYIMLRRAALLGKAALSEIRKE